MYHDDLQDMYNEMGPEAGESSEPSLVAYLVRGVS